MSSHLGVTQTLEVLEHLRNAARDFSVRTSKLEEDYRVRTNRAKHRRDTGLEELAQNLQAALRQEETAFATATERASANYEKRKIRIGKAYRTSKELGLSRVEDRIGQRKYALQRQMLQAERDRDSALANATATLEEFRSKLAAAQETLAGLEVAAAASFKGYRSFVRLLSPKGEPHPTEQAADDAHLLAELHEQLTKASAGLAELRRFFVMRFFRPFAFWFVLLLCLVPLVPALKYFGVQSFDYQAAGLCLGGGLFLVLLGRYLGARKAKAPVAAVATALTHARRLHALCTEKSEAHYQQELARVHEEFRSTSVKVDQLLKQVLAGATDLRAQSRTATDEKSFRASGRHDQLYKTRLERLNQQHAETIERLNAEAQLARQTLLDSAATTEKNFQAELQAHRQIFDAEWNGAAESAFETLNAAKAVCQRLFPPWNAVPPGKWTPPSTFAQAARFGDLRVNLDKAGAAIAQSELSIPLCLTYPEQGSILFETGTSGREQAIGSLNNIIFRLLSVAPPGRLNFTIIDPVGLGQNFAGVMHLADYEEQLIHSRIWTQGSQIEQRLADLNEHMEKVIQMYLRNEYATIAEYNEQAGVIAEKYQYLVVADFPVNFSDLAARRLLSIAASGARCGVYLLLHWDQRQPLPQDFVPEELRKSAVRVTFKGAEALLAGKPEQGSELSLEAPPPSDQAIQFIQTVGQSSRDSSRVEVPFSQVAPASKDIWSEETTAELRVPIGRTGATKLQYLALGKGTRQHGLLAGKTGSGKSTLFHVLITNLALWSSPEQIEFYLVDFKKGVEFKCYATHRLPHARVVAIESDREFGLSVLQKVDEELKRRGDLFRKLGVQDVAGYKRAGGGEALPRSLLLIDEFQEFFVEDDKISQTASLLLDRLVRQGRAFGIHVLLGSQTLGGAYTVARTTLGQMVVRIALQCNEADAYLIMDDNNPAPRLLSRPGEGIYNDTAGTIEGNSPFQVVWLPEAERDASLVKVRQRADQNSGHYPGPFVFEGNAPADVRENPHLQTFLQAESVQAPVAARIWLGAPNSIKGPTEALFHRQSGNNLLLVGQREEATLAIFSVALLSLAAQYPLGAARFIVCDATPPGSPARDYLEGVLRAIPHKVTLAKPGELPEIMQGLVEDMKLRTDDEQAESAAPAFLLIHGLQRFNKLRYEEDFGFSTSGTEPPPNPAALLNTLITEGTRLGFHVLASCDTYNNVTRFLSRKALSEFEMRVLFQMSVNDSASLIDNPKASTLGLHRALYYNEQEGYLETFRPYALPPSEWIEETGLKLRRLLKQPLEPAIPKSGAA